MEQFPATGLRAVDAADRKILLGEIRSQLPTEEKLNPLERNLDIYSKRCVVQRACADERKSRHGNTIEERDPAGEAGMPAILKLARENLRNRRRCTRKLRSSSCRGISDILKRTSLALRKSRDAGSKEESAKSNGQVIAALKEYEVWLKNDCCPDQREISDWSGELLEEIDVRGYGGYAAGQIAGGRNGGSAEESGELARVAKKLIRRKRLGK